MTTFELLEVGQRFKVKDCAGNITDDVFEKITNDPYDPCSAKWVSGKRNCGKCFFKQDTEVYLLANISDMYKLLEDIETWEAHMIEDDRVWNTGDGLPHWTQEICDEWMKLIYRRNEILGRTQGGI